MSQLELRDPIIFQPIFMERVWGGRRLEKIFRKTLPPQVKIGESWELVDRPEAQSIVTQGPLAGRTLHDLWTGHRREIFGDLPASARFPLLLKLLDAEEKLSLQVHPPAALAAELGGEPKTEFWYIAEATPQAELFVGLTNGCSREHVEEALRSGGLAELVHRIRVQRGDAMFLPSGRMHAIGAGNLIIEIQQNSDTTYRIYDWDRCDEQGRPRQLHVEESLRAIDFDDYEPALTTAIGESLVRHELFTVDKWDLDEPRTAVPSGQFGIIVCLTGGVRCGAVTIAPGHLLLVPAAMPERELRPAQAGTTLLRVTIHPPR